MSSRSAPRTHTKHTITTSIPSCTPRLSTLTLLSFSPQVPPDQEEPLPPPNGEARLSARKRGDRPTLISVNAAICNKAYEPVQLPVVVDLPRRPSPNPRRGERAPAVLLAPAAPQHQQQHHRSSRSSSHQPQQQRGRKQSHHPQSQPQRAKSGRVARAGKEERREPQPPQQQAQQAQPPQQTQAKRKRGGGREGRRTTARSVGGSCRGGGGGQ